MPEPLSVAIARELYHMPFAIDSEYAYDTEAEGIADISRVIDARIRPLVERGQTLLGLLQDARGYVADYAVTPDNSGGRLLALIDAELSKPYSVNPTR
jgi:hypothetical protein